MTARTSATTDAVPETAGRGRPVRLIVALAVTQSLGNGTLVQSFTVLLVPMSHDLGASRTAVAAAMTVSTLVIALAALPVGRLLDRYGGRALMTSGTVLGVVAVVLWSRADGLFGLYLAFVLVGLALAMSTYEAAFAVIVVATEAKHRDTAIVTITMVVGLATSFYYPLTGWLEGQLGWRDTLLVLAGALLAIAVPLHLLVVPSRATHVINLVGRGGVAVSQAIRSVRFWLLLLAFSAQGGVTAGFLLIMVSYFRDAGFSAGTASALPLAVGALQIGSRLALAPLARRFDMTRVTIAAFSLQGLGLALLPLAGTSVPLTLMCTAGFGLGLGISVVAMPSIVADSFGETGYASIVAGLAVPIALSSAGVPLLAAWLGDWRFLVGAGFVVVSAAAALAPLVRGRA